VAFAHLCAFRASTLYIRLANQTRVFRISLSRFSRFILSHILDGGRERSAFQPRRTTVRRRSRFIADEGFDDEVFVEVPEELFPPLLAPPPFYPVPASPIAPKLYALFPPVDSRSPTRFGTPTSGSDTNGGSGTAPVPHPNLPTSS